MITLYKDNLTDNPSYFELTGIASKEDLYTILKKIGHPLPKSKLKAEMRCHAANIFEADPFWYINALPSEEQKMIAQLADKKAGEYLEVDKREKFYDIQNFLLVVTYETPTKWHMYMPDNIRQKINARIADETSRYPTLQKFSEIMDPISGILNKIMDLVQDYDTAKSKNRKCSHPLYDMAKMDDMLYDLEDKEAGLKKIAPELEATYGIDLTEPFASIQMAKLMLSHLIMEMPIK